MLPLLLVLASNLLSMSHWTESRGVNDDVCYLRQAHLFQRHGLDGFDTSRTRDEDGYLAAKISNMPRYANSGNAPCHVAIPALHKEVMQYPPGTGLALALFPEGHQVVPLFALSTIIIFGFSVAAIWAAGSRLQCAGAMLFGCVALYLMINPTKASYSMAPTMVACALAGWLTARLFAKERRSQFLATAVLGLLIGFTVNFRLANLFLSAGYCVYFLALFVSKRDAHSFSRGFLFAVTLIIGMTPTLISNAINAGSPLSTTYGPGDAEGPRLNIEVVTSYLADPQFLLLLIAVVWTALVAQRNQRHIAGLLAANLFINALFFLTHPVFTPYYMMPIVALSLWTLLFTSINLQTSQLASLDVIDSAPQRGMSPPLA
jgi:hypothetical protein